jgi:hypothetical protein
MWTSCVGVLMLSCLGCVGRPTTPHSAIDAAATGKTLEKGGHQTLHLLPQLLFCSKAGGRHQERRQPTAFAANGAGRKGRHHA